MGRREEERSEEEGGGGGGGRAGVYWRVRKGEKGRKREEDDGGREGHNTITCGVDAGLFVRRSGTKTGDRGKGGPNGGWQDWIWKFNASNISATAPALGYSLSDVSAIRVPILAVSLFISWVRLQRRLRAGRRGRRQKALRIFDVPR